MQERAERLSKTEDQAEEMRRTADEFGSKAQYVAHRTTTYGGRALTDYYKNKRWWEL